MNNKHCLRVGENSKITKLKSGIPEQAGASARTVKIGDLTHKRYLYYSTLNRILTNKGAFSKETKSLLDVVEYCASVLCSGCEAFELAEGLIHKQFEVELSLLLYNQNMLSPYFSYLWC